MLKYLYCKEVFSEVPGEISLGISISGCMVRCKGCHSRELWEDKGTPLTIQELDRLLDVHKGITCLVLLGGEYKIDSLIELFQFAHTKIKTAWYCGLDRVPKEKEEILNYLNYLKVGHFDLELGGLDSPSTNQRFYKIISKGKDNQFLTEDITNKFQKH